jgi:ribulose-phosphate 3-epimerase
MIELAFSILAADFTHLADEIARAERGGGTIVHVDVMDGHFVPNITFGPPVVAAIRPITKLPLDCHLMIEDPDEFIPAFAAAGADMVSVHVEVCRHLNRTLQFIADHKMRSGVVLNPATPVEAVFEVLPMVHHVLVMSVNPGFGGQKFLPRSIERIDHLRRLREELGLNFRIEVDGGIGHDTVAEVVHAGADMLVAGSAIFEGGTAEGGKAGEPSKTEHNAREFLRIARSAASRHA